MSPLSSIPNQAAELGRKTAHSRRSSAAVAVQLPVNAIPTKQPSPIITSPSIHYTCFIRLPFRRPENFTDPPPVEWDSIKDKALWKLISKASNSRDLDWEAIAARFEVDLPFLLQQAAWLYERHFEGMKKQMQKLGVSSATPSAVPSPVPPESASASETAGSKESRMPSIMTARKDLPSASGVDSGSSPGTPRMLHPPISRTPSTTTVTQSRIFASGSKQPLQRGFRSSSGSQQRRPPPPQRPTESTQDDDEDDGESALGHDAPSETTDSEEEPSAMARSQAFRRGPLARPKPPTMRTVSSDGDAEDDEDDEDSGGYLPFAASTSKPATKEDSLKTVQSSPKRQQPTTTVQTQATSSKSRTPADNPPSSSASSASSAQPPASSEGDSSQQRPPGPISPRHRARLASLSPRKAPDGSEGSPSMGSSFSDLDEAGSVTQSALEEALLSMQAHGNMSAMGSMASRMSSLRDALGRKQ